MNNFKCVLKCFYVLLSFIFLYIDIFLFRFYLFIFSAGSVLFSIYFQLVILVLQLNIIKYYICLILYYFRFYIRSGLSFRHASQLLVQALVLSRLDYNVFLQVFQPVLSNLYN